MTWKRLSLAVTLVVAPFFFTIMLLPGCSRGSGKPKVAFITNNTAEFWNYAEAGCKDAAEKYGVEVLFRRPPNATGADQKQIIDAMLTKGVDAIAVSVIDPKNQTDYIKKVAKQVPLITVDNDAVDTGRLCYIGTNNIAAGEAVGELAKKAMPEGGTVAIFVGQTEPLNARERRQGVLNTLSGKKGVDGSDLGKYKLYGSGGSLAPFTDNLDGQVAKQNADNVLTQFPNDNKLCMIGLWAYNPPAIYEAAKAQKREGKIKIIGFDEDKNTLQGIRNGHIEGTVVQQPYQFGYEAVRVMASLAKGDRSVLPENGINYVDHMVITQENVDEFEAKLNKLMGTE